MVEGTGTPEQGDGELRSRWEASALSPQGARAQHQLPPARPCLSWNIPNHRKITKRKPGRFGLRGSLEGHEDI